MNERPPQVRPLAALLLFGVSFGCMEAAVVVYLRGLYEPLHQRLYPARALHDLFPLPPWEELTAADAPYRAWLVTELAREAATLVMLAAVALAVARNVREWFAAFLVAFGMWDVFYYVFLRALLGWPESLLDWDLLFLLPLPWAAPVLAPVLVALVMITVGGMLLRRPVRLRCGHWLAAGVGGLLLVLAFCWDHRNLTAGGMPNPFHWPLFAAGLGVGLLAFVHAVQRTEPAA